MMRRRKKQPKLLPEALILRKISVYDRRLMMLDRDLASFYGLTASEVKRRARRNAKRFPEDSLYELSEYDHLWLGIDCRDEGIQHPRHRPYAFTATGICAFAGLVRTNEAVEISIQLLRMFFRLEQYLEGCVLVGRGTGWHGRTAEGESRPPYGLVGGISEFFRLSAE